MSKRLGLIGVVVALGLLTSACVQQPPQGLAVTQVAADFSFGVRPAPAPAAAPAGFIVAPATQTAVAQNVPSFPTQPAITLTLPNLPPLLPLTQPLAACPTPLEGVFPALAAATDVPGSVFPKAGSFGWRYNGSEKETVATFTFNVPLVGTGTHKITDVTTKTTAGAYGYTVNETDPVSQDVVSTTYGVEPSGTTTEGATGLSAQNSLPTIVAPGAGLAITGITSYDPKTKATSTFKPITALNLLPLPATPGEQFTSVAIDPTNFAELEYDGTVGAPVRINACGQLMEGYTVTGKETFTEIEAAGIAATTATYTLVVAPQYGAIPIQETTVESLGTESYSLTSTIDEVPPLDTGPAAG